jgi:hypothetical protein
MLRLSTPASLSCRTWFTQTGLGAAIAAVNQEKGIPALRLFIVFLFCQTNAAKNTLK